MSKIEEKIKKFNGENHQSQKAKDWKAVGIEGELTIEGELLTAVESAFYEKRYQKIIEKENDRRGVICHSANEEESKTVVGTEYGEISRSESESALGIACYEGIFKVVQNDVEKMLYVYMLAGDLDEGETIAIVRGEDGGFVKCDWSKSPNVYQREAVESYWSKQRELGQEKTK